MKTVAIIAGGASINNGIDNGLWDKIKHLDVWSINYAYLSMPYLPKKELFIDRKFFQHNINSMEELSKNEVELYARSNQMYSYLPIKQFETIREYTSKEDMILNNTRYIGSIGFSGFFALSCAIADDYNRIFLLGYDAGTKNKGDTSTHFYQDKFQVYSTGIKNTEVYYIDNRQEQLNKDFNNYNKENVEIYNVSIDSNIHCFNKITYDNFFNMIKE